MCSKLQPCAVNFKKNIFTKNNQYVLVIYSMNQYITTKIVLQKKLYYHITETIGIFETIQMFADVFLSILKAHQAIDHF